MCLLKAHACMYMYKESVFIPAPMPCWCELIVAVFLSITQTILPQHMPVAHVQCMLRHQPEMI